jgi:hypothetical protein
MLAALREIGGMKLFRDALKILAVAALAGSFAAQADPGEVGARYQLQIKHHGEYSSADGQGSSSGTDTIVVKAMALRDGGQELEFDLPDEVEKENRLIAWQLPARLFVAADGTQTLLNRSELEARRDQFLKANNWTSEACGHWLFTWDAFQIECDPNSIFAIVDSYALQPAKLADGALFSMPGADGSAAMKCRPVSQGKQRCSVSLPINAAAVRSELADSDVATGEITGKPVSRADAAKARAATQVSGTIEVTLEADVQGVVTRRTVVTTMEKREASGETETSRSTAVTTRTKL